MQPLEPFHNQLVTVSKMKARRARLSISARVQFLNGLGRPTAAPTTEHRTLSENPIEGDLRADVRRNGFEGVAFCPADSNEY
jgi:hypothetical protein